MKNQYDYIIHNIFILFFHNYIITIEMFKSTCIDENATTYEDGHRVILKANCEGFR